MPQINVLILIGLLKLTTKSETPSELLLLRQGNFRRNVSKRRKFCKNLRRHTHTHTSKNEHKKLLLIVIVHL